MYISHKEKRKIKKTSRGIDFRRSARALKLLVAALRARPGCRVSALASPGASVPFPAGVTAAAVMASVSGIIAPPLLVT